MNLIALLIWFLIIPVWLKILTLSKRSLMQPSAISILFGFILIFQYLGLPLLYFDVVSDIGGLKSITPNKSTVFYLFLMNTFVTTCLLIGYFIADKSIVKPIRENQMIRNNFELKSGDLFTSLLLFAICSIVLIVFINSIGFYNVALIGLFSAADQLSGISLRSNMTDVMSGSHWYKLFMKDLLSIATISLLIISINKKSFMLRMFTFFSVFLCFFSFLLTLEKAPIVGLILMISVGIVLSSQKGQFNLKALIILFIFLLTLLSTMYILFMSDTKGLLGAFESIYKRVLTGSLIPGYYYLEYFPHIEDFILGRSMPNPANLFPFESYNLTKEISLWAFPEDRKAGISGSMPAFFWGEFYANFGVLAALLGSAIIGFLLRIIDYAIDNRGNNPLIIALSSWVIIHFAELSSTGFTTYLLDVYLIFSTVVVFTLVIFQKLLFSRT